MTLAASTPPVSSPAHRPQWFGAMEQSAIPFETQRIPVVEGHLPEELAGTLYRNGPGQLVRNGVRTGHWFDGDGAVLAVRFGDGEATATYRYVDTEARREEERAGRWLYGNYGMLPAGNWWQRMTEGRSLKNAANTSVLALPDRLLALWEGGRSHRLDLDTLETLGLEDFGELPGDRSYSAHPKIDPKSGEIYNFGMVPGPVAKLWLYRGDATGKLLKQNLLKLPRVSLTHDFALAGPYLVFFIPPTQLQLAPVVFSLKSFSESLQWKPELGTTILIFDRETLALVNRAVVEPWFQWHFSHGRLDCDGKVHIGFVGYDSFSTNQYLKEVASGKIETSAFGTLREVSFDPNNPEKVEHKTWVNQQCEFPVVNDWANISQQPPPDIYFSAHRPNQTNEPRAKSDLFWAIAHYQPATDQLTVIDAGEGHYPSEPIVVYDQDNFPQWLLTVVYDGINHCSQVWIYNAASSDHLQDGAIAKLQLPSVIPHSFHGTWSPA
ncbi:MAG: carotenoid oxygenase family protein [Cyanobacteria bacterium P01_C01_bin.89]